MVLQTDLETAVETTDNLPDAAAVHDLDKDIPIREIFDDQFVSVRTDFATFDELVAASPADAASADDLDRVSDGAWDEFVAARTDFADEEAFVFAARDHWVAKTLGLL